MGGKQNVIEINGKKYDAATGKQIGTLKAPSRSQTQGQVLDGFTTRKPAATKPTTVASVTKTKKTGPSRQKAAHASKPVQKSQTLMRSAVKKPTAKQAKKTTPQSKADLGSSTTRYATAKSVAKNPKVHRYGAQAQHRSSVVKKVQPLAVKKPAAPTHAPLTSQHSRHAVATTTHQKPHMSAAAKMIEKSLANATAHEHLLHKKPKKRRKLAHKFGVSARTMAISSTVLAGVLLGGFFAVQNVPNLSMRVAAARAGFDARMPGYSPSGFSFKGPINYSAGRVTVSFASNTDERGYNVTQRTSNWNSDALLANFILEEEKQYQTYVDKGRTLFIYDGSNATWVDNGVWYSVEGESAMTTDQLIRIASSI